MDVSTLFQEPEQRRLWLLVKALEASSLDEALRLARTAEDFLNGLEASRLGATIPAVSRVRAEKAPVSAQPTIASEESGAELDDPFSAGDPAPRGTHELPISDAATETHNLQSDEATLAAVADGLVVLASPDDVVRYLRQRDDVVVREGQDAYIVNGRFRESLTELTKRANRMRARDKLPIFQVMPLAFTQQPKIAAHQMLREQRLPDTPSLG
jgi:hypothetical protein